MRVDETVFKKAKKT
jgi:hypothetical protein